MNITERLRLELLIREQIAKHGEDFYTELSRVLEKIQNENNLSSVAIESNQR